jgi:hypothetical protein
VARSVSVKAGVQAGSLGLIKGPASSQTGNRGRAGQRKGKDEGKGRGDGRDADNE